MQSVNVREGPSTTFSAIRALIPGTGVEVLSQNPEGTWYNIKMEDGTEGWISSALVFLEATPTPFPTMTPSPDLTALALGTALPTALIGGGAITPTPPLSAVSATPPGTIADDASVQTDDQPTQPFLPVLDLDAINQTATALAAGASSLSLPLPQPPTAATGQSPNHMLTAVATSTPAPTTSGASTVRQNVEVFAMCDDPIFGAAPPRNLAAGSTITIFWGWFMADPSYLEQHEEAVNYQVRVNDELLADWRLYGARVRPVGNSYVKYWFVPYGPLEAGDYRITYRATWNRQISDGYENFGPGTSNPAEEGSCTFTVR
jgi:hypothetical protein